MNTVSCSSSSGGFRHSYLLTSHLISAHLPFLPMELKHVKKCIVDSLLEKGYYTSRGNIDEGLIGRIAEEVHFYPEDLPLFSITGCKKVPQRVDYVMEGERTFKDEL